MRISFIIGLISALYSTTSVLAQSRPSTWVAVDGLGRKIETTNQYSTSRNNKFAGIFYLVWHGAHGYDRYNHSMTQEAPVLIPSPTDTLSPYNIQELVNANPENPAYGPVIAMHHWGEPYLGYYIIDDEWVIRKHAQMLSDAGVDVIIIDQTNRSNYIQQLTKLCDVYLAMRKEGSRTPQVSFVFNTTPEKMVPPVYETIYSNSKYRDLWFLWKGKPLLFAPPGLDSLYTAFFTVRQSWFGTDNFPEFKQTWFGDGKDKAPWGDYYPQKYGWHESPDLPEMISVAPATHPISDNTWVRRVGRSFHNGIQPPPGEQHPELGLCFAEQFSRAMEVDPEFIFFTGWNEWIACRLINDGRYQTLADKSLKKEDSFFWDDYNYEYSRDLEPLRGGFGDNYYYQLVDFIRRYKGVEPLPTFRKRNRIRIDGDFSDWEKVAAAFRDDPADVFHRNHVGYGFRLGKLVNKTGRNDIVVCKVAGDKENLFFYAEAGKPLSPDGDNKWMRLFISIAGRKESGWEGFHYVLNRTGTGYTLFSLDLSSNGWEWTRVSDIRFRNEGNRLEVAIPYSLLDIKNNNDFTIDFKWVDNAIDAGDIQECLTDGDSAPNGRFRYRYIFKSE